MFGGWYILATPNPAVTSGSYLNGVSCTPKPVFPFLWVQESCMAAGWYTNGAATYALAEGG